jgi:hypothetical protein
MKNKILNLVKTGCCGRSKNCHGGRCDNVSKTASLSELINHYKICCYPRLADRLKAFQRLTLDEAVDLAARGKEAHGKHMAHLRCLPTKSLKKAKERLNKNLRSLQNCQSFDELYSCIETTIAKIPRLKEMYVYDVALRIGATLKNLYPQKIYIQRGVRVGAEALLNKKCRERTMKCSDFPQLHTLKKAMQMEDFLCIFKNHPALKK